jgi:hypothetical protein
MKTATANSATSPRRYASLSVRGVTKDRVTRVREQFRRDTGKDISEDGVVNRLVDLLGPKLRFPAEALSIGASIGEKVKHHG